MHLIDPTVIAAQVHFRVSALIQNLEEELGLLLLSRDNYRPALTDSGRVIYEKTQLLLEQSAQLISLAQQLSGNEEPVVTLAINAVCPLADLQDRLQEIEHCFPATQMRLSIEHMGGAVVQLPSCAADLVISTRDDVVSGMIEMSHYLDVNIVPVEAPLYRQF